MAPRSSCKGFLKLSLVSVSVQAYTATATGSDIVLHQLHARTHTRVQYKKGAPGGGEVSGDEIVKGCEHAKGQYVVIDDDELDKLRTDSDKSVRIGRFITPEQLDGIHLGGRTDYLTPDGAVGQKPYALLVQGMRANKVCAVAEVVIAQRGQVVLLRPVDGVLAMTILNRHDWVKQASAFRDEIQGFDLARCRDAYKDKLTRLIQLKVEGQEIVQVHDPEEPKIINLMEALKRSVAEAQAAATGAEAAAGAEGGNGRSVKAGLRQAPSARTPKAAAKKRKAG